MHLPRTQNQEGLKREKLSVTRATAVGSPTATKLAVGAHVLSWA